MLQVSNIYSLDDSQETNEKHTKLKAYWCVHTKGGVSLYFVLLRVLPASLFRLGFRENLNISWLSRHENISPEFKYFNSS